MSKSLNPSTLCNIYTLAEIQAKVDFYLNALEEAVTKEYRRDTSQGSIMAESADIDKIESVLAMWLKALECKKGLGGVRQVSVTFGGCR